MFEELLTVPYLFVIDANKYAGNFEREMCAYLTGHVGDCGVGEEYCQEQAVEFHNVTSGSDEHGCSRPVSIYPTPGWFNDGLGHEYKEGADPEEVIRKYREANVEYFLQHKLLERAEEAKTSLPGHYPSYQSVAILFSEKPSDEQIKIMKEQAAKFVTLPKFSEIKITGFRIVKRIIQIDEEPV